MSRTTIQSAVDSILKEHPQGIDFAELQALLAARQIDVQPYAPGGVLKGVSYLFDSVKWPGSKIGSDYSAGLTGRGVRYSAEVPQGVTVTPPGEPKRSLVRQSEQHQIQAAQPAKWRLDTSQASSEQYIPGSLGPVFQACLLLTAEAINMALALWEKIVAFIKSILAKIGIGIAPGMAGNHLVLGPDPIIDVEARVVEDADQLQIAQAARTIEQVAAAITNRDPSMLPEGPGREELVAAMENEFKKEGSTEQTETDPFQFFGDEPELHTPAREPAKPLAWPALKAAAEAHHLAALALAKARAAALETDDIWDMVPEATKAEDRAGGALLKVRSDFKQWVAANRVAAALGRNPYTADIKAAEALLARRRAELAAAQKDEASKSARAVRRAPIELVLAEQSAAERLTTARVSFMAVARKNLEIVRQNPMQIPLATELETQIRRGIGSYVFSRDNSTLESHIARLKAAVEAERRRQNPAPYDADAEEEMQRLRAESEAAPK